jgi:hypothetical protein
MCGDNDSKYQFSATGKKIPKCRAKKFGPAGHLLIWDGGSIIYKGFKASISPANPIRIGKAERPKESVRRCQYTAGSDGVATKGQQASLWQTVHALVDLKQHRIVVDQCVQSVLVYHMLGQNLTGIRLWQSRRHNHNQRCPFGRQLCHSDRLCFRNRS